MAGFFNKDGAPAVRRQNCALSRLVPNVASTVHSAQCLGTTWGFRSRNARANLVVLTLRSFYHIQKSSGAHWEGVVGPRARLDVVKRYSFPRAPYGGGKYIYIYIYIKEKGKGKKAE